MTNKLGKNFTNLVRQNKMITTKRYFNDQILPFLLVAAKKGKSNCNIFYNPELGPNSNEMYQYCKKNERLIIIWCNKEHIGVRTYLNGYEFFWPFEIIEQHHKIMPSPIIIDAPGC